MNIYEIFGTKNLRVKIKSFYCGCLPQILFGPLLNILSHDFHRSYLTKLKCRRSLKFLKI